MMKTQHWALLAAAAFLYYMTTQRKNVSIIPALPGFDPGSGPTTGPGAWDGSIALDTGFVAPGAYGYQATRSTPWTVGGYEGGMNWPARDNIFG